MRITKTVLSLPEDAVPIVAAHNGPTGLGGDAWSICGADFKPRAGGLLIGMLLFLQNPCSGLEKKTVHHYGVAMCVNL